MTVKVKICGLTRPEDLEAAVNAGADALGLVFVPRSPRNLEIAQASELATMIPGGIEVVGLFMDASPARVEEVIERVSLTALQFHGLECNDYCQRFGLPWLKALPMGGSASPDYRLWPDACALLLDGHVPGKPGGRGEAFNWQQIPLLEQKIILAGGLNPDNVGRAIGIARPWGVDVSSGVESSPGIKDRELMMRFCDEVRARH